MLYCQILLELCQFINVRFLQDFSNPDAEVVIDDHHIASGDALAVDQQIHRLARQLIQHHQGSFGKGNDVLDFPSGPADFHLYNFIFMVKLQIEATRRKT